MIDTFILCLVRYAVIASVLCAQVVLAGEFTIVKALKFSPEAPKLTLDLYLLIAQEKPAPCVIVIRSSAPTQIVSKRTGRQQRTRFRSIVV